MSEAELKAGSRKDVACQCGVLHTLLQKNIRDLKIASRKNTVNPEQVSFVIPVNISVAAFSRTVICGRLSSSWLPKSHNITHACSHMMFPVFFFERLENVKIMQIMVSIRDQQRHSKKLMAETRMSQFTCIFKLL